MNDKSPTNVNEAVTSNFVKSLNRLTLADETKSNDLADQINDELERNLTIKKWNIEKNVSANQLNGTGSK